jgi:ubiquinone/menaquinone biosynthesis C-methylase UbiE
VRNKRRSHSRVRPAALCVRQVQDLHRSLGRRILETTPADAEALPFADDSCDFVLSAIGVVFTADHQRADELVRVGRPGARIGMANWIPTGFGGQF